MHHPLPPRRGRVGQRGVSLSALALILGVLVGCTPAAPSSTPSGQVPAAPSAPKTLVVAVNREPPEFAGGFTGSSGSGGAGPIKHIVHATLVTANDSLVLEPELAVDLLSIEKGNWKLNADGTMDTTWKLRPNTKWHDGTPFTSEDLLFTFMVNKDPELPTPWTSQLALMESASAPDPLTFVVHWSKPFFEADAAAGLDPLPRHLLRDLYQAGDKTAFGRSPVFSTQFVGLGPYKLSRWEPGTEMELTRFAEFVLGRPPFDSVIVRFVFDGNTMIANILSGNVDVIIPPSVSLDTAFEIRQRWEGTGNQVLMVSNQRERLLEIQHRQDTARPRFGLTILPVRTAFYQGIDRQGLVDAVNQGLTSPADSWISPSNPLRAQVEADIPKLPYDPKRAQQLLADAGWTRPAGGTLTHTETGEPFAIPLRADAGAGKEREITIVGEYWKALGAVPEIDIIPSAREGDREYESLSPGLLLTANLTGDSWFQNRTLTSQISTPANRWTGRNRMGYSNPAVDPIVEKLNATIDPRERLPLHRQLLQVQGNDLPMMPLYWEIVPVFAVKGVKPGNAGVWTLSNFVNWTRDS
jgi:peptide/nickel transport system substrate-binding protein